MDETSPLDVLAVAGDPGAGARLGAALAGLGLKPQTALGGPEAIAQAASRRTHLIVACGGARDDLRDDLTRAVRRKGQPNRLTPVAAVSEDELGDSGGGDELAKLLCRHLLAACPRKKDILALYRELGRERYREFFKLYAALAGPNLRDGHGGRDTQPAR